MLWLLVLLGTAIRFFYGRFSHPWYIAPDQLAWQMGLDDMFQTGNWRLLQLGHAPHEGGSVLIGLLSVLFYPFRHWLPALSMAALLVDTFVRLLQIRIARQLFGSATAWWFGGWTVLSVPLLLPWSVVNFGLHYPASVFPFVFFWLLARYHDHRYFSQCLGIYCGIAIWFSYDNCLLLVPAMLFLWKLPANRSRSMRLFFGFLFVGLLPHVWIRLLTDTGYPLQHGLLVGREQGFFTQVQIKHLLLVWFTVLPASLLLGSPSFVPLTLLLIITFFFIVGGIALYRRANRLVAPILFFVVVFMVVYALSPFFATAYRSFGYTVFRHLAYIIPLLVLLMIDGFVRSGKWKRYWLGTWLLFSAMASIVYIRNQYTDEQAAYRAAGWILVQKYGTDITQLFRLQSTTDTAFRHSVASGFGWGMAASMLQQPGDTIAVKQLQFLIHESPVSFKADMISGVQHAFAPAITPKLPETSFQLFNLE